MQLHAVCASPRQMQCMQAVWQHSLPLPAIHDGESMRSSEPALVIGYWCPVMCISILCLACDVCSGKLTSTAMQCIGVDGEQRQGGCH